MCRHVGTDTAGVQKTPNSMRLPLATSRAIDAPVSFSSANVSVEKAASLWGHDKPTTQAPLAKKPNRTNPSAGEENKGTKAAPPGRSRTSSSSRRNEKK